MLKCNINRRGRLARLILGLLAIALANPFSIAKGDLVITSAVLTIGAFAVFEAALGWCAVVASLERLKRGISRNRIVRLLLGSLT